MVMGYEKALKSMWLGCMNVIVREQTKNAETKQMEFTEKVIIENEPCRLSFSSSAPTTNSIGAAETTQNSKLFCSATLDIPEGSKIVITQKNRTIAYQKSGTPSFYSVHQEIPIELFERWA